MGAQPLVRTQGRVQVLARIGLGRDFRLLHFFEQFFERISGDNARPHGARRLRPRLTGLPGIKTGQKAQTFEQGHSAGTRNGLNFFPMLQDFLEFVPVHLDPLAFEQDQPAGGLEDGVQLRFGERFALQRHLHFEVQQAVGAEQLSLGLADANGHLRPGGTARLPPIRNSIQQLTGHFALLRRALHRRQ